MNAKTLWLVTVVSILLPLFGGCQKYKQKIKGQQDDIAKLQADNAECGENNKLALAEKEKLEKQIAELEADIAKALEYQKALENQIEKLGGDKNKIAEKFKAAQANMEEQQKLIDEMKRKQAQAQARLDTLKKMLSQFKSLIAGGKLKVRIRKGKLMLELPSAILFESGKAELSKEGGETLSQVGAVLATIRNREFQVAGHTDNVPIAASRDRFPTNWELSAARAVTVVKFFQSKGVNPKFLSAAGYSEYQAAASNQSEDGKTQNRRIEITLMPNLDELPDMSELEKELTK